MSVNLAVQGLIRGGLALDILTDDDADAIKDAAAEWSARWEGPEPGDIGNERARWDDDWSLRENDVSGWRNLLRYASGLGVNVQPWLEQTAEAEFASVPLPPETTYVSDPAAEAVLWRQQLQRTEKGAIRGNLLNARIALQKAPAMAKKLGYDVFSDVVVVREAPPWDDESMAYPRPLVDADSIQAATVLQAADIQVSSAIAHEALVATARLNRFDPVREYLHAGKWDGVPRLDTWTIDYLGAVDSAYTRAISAKALIASVARVERPGCKVDTVPLLEGPQGIGKSAALRTLYGAEYFTDHMPELTDKDAAIQLQGVWCVEFAELDKLGKAEASRAKAFITTQVDRFRRPYGRTTENVPRRCVFWGTLNPGGTGYLRDETGNRRYWPVTCAVGWAAGQMVDVVTFSAVRDQLWAEAHARWAAGESHWLDRPEHQAEQARIVGHRLDEDVWTGLIQAFVATRGDVSTGEILGECLFKPRAIWTKQGQMRVGAVLTALGWARKQIRAPEGGREWRYLRSGHTELPLMAAALSPPSPLVEK